MNLILISGQEATGKSYVGQSIAQSLGYEYIGKDKIKEAMFDKYKHSSWDYSWYENKAKKDLFQQINELKSNGVNVIVESNFIGKDKAKLQVCLQHYATVYEVYCYSKGLTTFKRFVARNESGQRHKGHHDRRWYLKILLEDSLQYLGVRWPSKPTNLGNTLIQVNTTDLSKVDIQKLLAQLNMFDT